MTHENLGFALRPGVFSPKEIIESANVLDRNAKISHIFIPDGRSGYESIEIASSILATTRRVNAGSGVIRLLEHDPLLLARRVHTMQAFSSNRFILGVGTGPPGPHPGGAVTAMIHRLEELKKGFQGFPRGVEAPKTFVATLKPVIAKRVVGTTDGLLLNFCSPSYANRLIESLGTHARRIPVACYLKIFFSSENDLTARRLMLQEFLNYDSTPQYHEMFLQDGTSGAINALKEKDEWRNGPVELPEKLLNVSLPNPTAEQLRLYVQSFREAGVTLPVVYPYFPGDEKTEFKFKTVERLQSL